LTWRIKSEDSAPGKEGGKQTDNRTGAKVVCSWREYHSLQVKNGESVVHCRAQLPDLVFLFWRPGAKGGDKFLRASGLKQHGEIK